MICSMPKIPTLLRAAQSRSVVIAVALKKGGVGKTTTTINLAYELSKFTIFDEVEGVTRPVRVLAIDMDPQGNTTSGLGVAVPEVGDPTPTLYNVLHPEKSRRISLNEVIVGTQFGVDLAPARKQLDELDMALGPGGQMRLARELEKLPAYDVVIIDCRPTLNELTAAALSAATTVLAPVLAGRDEVEALASLEEAVENAGLNNPGIKIRHVLVTNYLATKATRAIRRRIEDEWEKEFLGVISRTVKVTEAKAYSQPLGVYDPSCTAAQDYHDVALKLAEEELGHV